MDSFFCFCSRVHGVDLPGEGIGGCTFQMLVYCRSLVGVACNSKKNKKAVLAAAVFITYLTIQIWQGTCMLPHLGSHLPFFVITGSCIGSNVIISTK